MCRSSNLFAAFHPHCCHLNLILNPKFLSVLSVLPALLNNFPYSLLILLLILPVQIRRLHVCRTIRVWIIKQTIPVSVSHRPFYQTALLENIPLNTRQNRSHIVRRTPPILQDVQAQFPRGINIRMEHLTDELDSRRFIRVCFLKVHYKAESAVFKGCIGGAYYYGVPGHDVVADGGGGDSRGRVCLHAFKVSH